MRESNLIKNYIQGNELNMEEVMMKYTPYIYTIIKNKDSTLSSEDIEEIISDVFLAVWKNQSKLDRNKEMSTYLVGVTKNLSDAEVLKYYIDKLEKVGGESKARYKTGIAIINKEGKEFSTTIDEEEFVMTSKINNAKFLSGGILDLISFDPINNKYFNELDDEEKAIRYKKIDEETRKIIKDVFYK